MAFTPSSNLAHQIANYISEKIVHAEFKPGERIIEDRLARELNVSRIPLREALRLLEKNGLVELTPRRGVRVTNLTRANVEYTYDILAELYGLIFRKLIAMGDPRLFVQIDTVIKELEHCANTHDVEGFYKAIFKCGVIMLNALQAPLLERIIGDLWPCKQRVEYYITNMKKEILVESASLYRQAFQYASAGDTERALLAIKAHMQGHKAYALEHVPLD